MQLITEPSRDTWIEIIQRPVADTAELNQVVSAILDDVKQNGDAAIKKYCLRFGKADLENLEVSKEEFMNAHSLVDDNLKAAIQTARINIEKFHLSQREEVHKVETSKDVFCWRKSVAIENVGLYIPGGTAPLFSTLLMLGIPAVMAGCKEIIVCTPSDANGKVDPVILYVADILGLKNIYRVGGVQAIAALAYGSESIRRVDKIFGPGNQYVTCGKQLVNSQGWQ